MTGNYGGDGYANYYGSSYGQQQQQGTQQQPQQHPPAQQDQAEAYPTRRQPTQYHAEPYGQDPATHHYHQQQQQQQQRYGSYGASGVPYGDEPQSPIGGQYQSPYPQHPHPGYLSPSQQMSPELASNLGNILQNPTAQIGIQALSIGQDYVNKNVHPSLLTNFLAESMGVI